MEGIVGPDQEHGIDVCFFQTDVDGGLAAGQKAADRIFFVGADTAVREEDEFRAEGI